MADANVVVSGEAQLQDISEQLLAAADAAQQASSGIVELGQSGDGLATLMAALDGASAATAANTEAVQALTAAMGELQGSVLGNSDALAADTAAMQANSAAAAENAAAHGAQAGGLDLGLQRVGMRMMMFGGLGLAAGAGFLYFGSQAQAALNVVQAFAIGGANSAQVMAQYNDKLETLAENTGVGMKEAAQGLYYVLSAQLDHGTATVGQNMDVLRLALEHARAAGADMGVVANGLTSYLNAMGASSKDAGKYADMMTAAVTAGKMSVQDFSGAIGRASVFGNIFGIQADEVAAAIAQMTHAGLDASVGGENLSFLFRAIGDPDKTKAMADALGLQFDEAAYKSKSFVEKLRYLRDGIGATNVQFDHFIGGARGTVAAGALLNDGGVSYANILKQIDDSNGKSKIAFDTYRQTVTYSVDTIKASLSVFALELTKAVTPVVKPILDGMAAAFRGLGDAIKQHKEVVAPILAALGTLFTGMFLVGLSILAHALVVAAGAAAGFAIPVLAIMGALLLLGAGLKLVIDHMGGMHNFLKALQPAIKPIQDAFAYMGAEIKKALADPQIHLALRDLMTALPNLLPILKIIAIVIVGTVVVAIRLFTVILTTVIGMIPGFVHIVEGIINVFGGFVRLIVDLFTNHKDIGNALRSMGFGIMQIIAGIGQELLGAGINLIVSLANGITKGAGDHLKKALQNVGESIKNFLGFKSPTKEGPGSEADVWAPNFMTMFARGITAGLPGVAQAANTAAGILRTALGGGVVGGFGGGLGGALSGVMAGGGIGVPPAISANSQAHLAVAQQHLQAQTASLQILTQIATLLQRQGSGTLQINSPISVSGGAQSALTAQQLLAQVNAQANQLLRQGGNFGRGRGWIGQ